MRKLWRWILACWLAWSAAACGTAISPINQLPLAPPLSAPSPTSTPLPAQPTPTRPPTLTPLSPRVTPTSRAALRLWLDPLLPAALRAALAIPGGVESVRDGSQADLRLSFRLDPAAPALAAGRWTYALAARFPTLLDDISSKDLLQVWRGGDAAGHVLLMDQETRAVFSVLWGPPALASLQILPAGNLLDGAWKNPSALVILPFEALGPRWKVLSVDGLSVLDPAMPPSRYPLSVEYALSLAHAPVQDLPTIVLPSPNRDPSLLVSLTMTGTTALVRKTAEMMNEQGVDYPARDIGALLRSSDLTHISNEVSFNQDCSPARAASGEGIFCSAPDYIRLLEDVGADIIELTGNHNLDKGADAYLYTLDQYAARHWLTYGGGLDQELARKPLLVQRGATRLAFLGCNMAGPDIAWAGEHKPGAATCDIDWMEQQVRALRAQGVLPVVTFQAFETEDYMPAPMQRPSDFTRLAAAGAMIVSGSQAHFPQGFGFSAGGLIHYGLGNLFFDQVEPVTIRRAFVDRHIFYADKYLGVQLVTVQLEEYGKPRLMTAAERQAFLKDVFAADGW